MPSTTDLLLGLLMVLLVGGVIGLEREFRNKSAGFRTMILICLGSYLFTLFSISITGSTNDRIASNIVTGIGFIGAGVIFQSDNRMNGLTTAATIWVTAALGMGIGGGYFTEVIFATILVMVSLLLLNKLEEAFDRFNSTKVYKVTIPYKENLLEDYETLLQKHKLKAKRLKQTKDGNHLIGSWEVKGPQKAHKAFVEDVLQDPFVTGFEF